MGKSNGAIASETLLPTVIGQQCPVAIQEHDYLLAHSWPAARYLGTDNLETLTLLCGVSPAVQAQGSAHSSGNRGGNKATVLLLSWEIGLRASCISVLQSCMRSHAVCVVMQTKVACAVELQSLFCVMCRHKESCFVSPLEKKYKQHQLGFLVALHEALCEPLVAYLLLSGNPREVVSPMGSGEKQHHVPWLDSVMQWCFRYPGYLQLGRVSLSYTVVKGSQKLLAI